MTTTDASTSPTNRRRLAWLVAGPAVGLMGGAVAGLADSVVAKEGLRDLMTTWLWLDMLSFSVITHSVPAIVISTGACLVGGLAGRCNRRLRDRLQPGPIACAGLLVGQTILIGLTVAAFHRLSPPRNLVGLAGTVGVWLIALVPTAWVCLWLRPRAIGRLVARLSRVAVWLALALMVTSIGIQWQGRPRIQEPDDSWSTAASRPADRRDGRPPNVVLIVFDTLRVDRLGCYGYQRPTSPHIDAFATDAAVFERAISPAPWTLPSHASMFTGLYPSQHGTMMGWLDDGFVTLAEALRDRGYQTMGLSNNGLVSHATKLTQGFERFAEPQELLYRKRCLAYLFVRHALSRGGPMGPLLGRWFSHDAGGRAANQLARRWLRDRDRSRPFLLFLNYMEPHGPWEPKSAYRERFVQPSDSNRSYWIDQSRMATWLYMLTGKPIYTARDLAILSDLYDARVRELDDIFADLMRVLDAEVDLNQTIVVAVSDHGENIGEHGLLGHQFSIHNTLLHVPLMVRWPRVLKPQRVDRMVQTCDVFPTILGWTGAEASQPTKMMARSLAAAMSPTSQDVRRYGIAEYLNWPEPQLAAVQQVDPTFDPTRWRATYRAIFDEQWKLVLGTGNRVELYNLASDPSEDHNVAAISRPTVVRLSQQVGRWLGSFKRFDMNQITTPADPRLDEERRQRLHDLGYIQ